MKKITILMTDSSDLIKVDFEPRMKTEDLLLAFAQTLGAATLSEDDDLIDEITDDLNRKIKKYRAIVNSRIEEDIDKNLEEMQ